MVTFSFAFVSKIYRRREHENFHLLDVDPAGEDDDDDDAVDAVFVDIYRRNCRGEIFPRIVDNRIFGESKW